MSKTPNMMRQLAILRALSWRQRALLVEAALFLTAAAAAIACLPFARVARLASGRPTGLATEPDSRRVAAIRWAVEGVARRLPFRAKCFECGLAAQWMLQRRGIAATLFYGATLGTGDLTAHVWVRAGGLDVVGCDNATDFAVLARFPPEAVKAPQPSRPPSIR